MKKSFLLLASVVLCFLLTSCGFSREAVSNIAQQETSVVLNQNNFEIIKSVKGECSQVYVLGFGGISKKSLGESAMSQMIENAELTGAQAIVNTSVSYKTQHYILVHIIKATATGTVIEFTR